MNAEKKSNKFKLSKIKMPKLTKKKKIIIVGICIIILGGIYGYSKINGSNSTDTINTATVTKGDITVSIEGSGVIEPLEMYEITPLVTGDILISDFEEGQEVKKGDLLYVIDTVDADYDIEKSQVSLDKQLISYNEELESYNNLSIKTPISGVITDCYVTKGDSVKSGDTIADIVNSDYMMLEIPFNSSDVSNFKVGSSASVILEDSSYETIGTVQYISSGEILKSSGATVSIVKIKVKNPGSITVDDEATAIINNVACNSAGIFDYWEQRTVKAEASGDVASVNYTTGDKVNSGNVIVDLESDDAEISLKQSELSLKSTELALQNTKDQLDDYNITSPIDGTILEKQSKAGDTLDSSDKTVNMAVIADMSKLTFDIDVDELDIGDIAVGQEVQVTADSLENKTFVGAISNISAIGTSSDGVATYPVTVVMDYTEDLMIGMNVNAEIVIESMEDVLQIPSSALSRGNRVLVKDEDGSKAASQVESDSKKSSASVDVPDGYTYVTVEIGISDTDFVEIKSGLEEGDIVVIPTKATTTTEKATSDLILPGSTSTTGGQGGQGGPPPGGQ
ncbi:MAG: efflux RND transporter periplasmic adaptor subunit [Sedimentibacter sp.]